MLRIAQYWLGPIHKTTSPDLPRLETPTIHPFVSHCCRALLRDSNRRRRRRPLLQGISPPPANQTAVQHPSEGSKHQSLFHSSTAGPLPACHRHQSAASLPPAFQQTLGGQMSKGLIWATAEDLSKNRGRVLSLYRQVLRSLNSPDLPLNLAARLHRKAQARAIFMVAAEERSIHNIKDLIDVAEYSLSLLRKGEIPKYIQ
ncbi:hypothetical protein L1987_56893 [Smallanthus sonchifolius]|uniref:Uncharacterized protein n=1 Tax=Smallanthus sonchifolius TaxID=185202 RepID=A0ACB9DBI6_9ASTR|nr:hypothetical protein L1987_56893 [Smallanthus sonchifolius]